MLSNADHITNPTMPKIIDVVLNSGSGTTADESADEITALFQVMGVDTRIHALGEGSDVEATIRPVVESDAEIIVAAGGDGTVSAVAAAVSEAGKILGVLPMGTLNNFSKDVGIPQELDLAAEVIANGRITKIDLGSVNGQAFVNNSSIGLYPQIVKRRENQQRLGRGKLFAALWAALKVLRLSRQLRVKLVIDGKEMLRKTPFVFVGNNIYDMDLYNIGRRPKLDDGKLSVYFLRRGGRWGVILMLLKTMIGQVKQWKDFEEIETEQLTIVSRKRRLRVAFDGEVKVMETPLEYRTLPKALTVIVPVKNAE